MTRRLAARPCAAHLVFALALLLAGGALKPGSAGAQAGTGPFFEPGPALSRAYEVRLSAVLDHASRDDFSRPVLLFRQQLDELEALALTTQIDLRLALAPGFALQAIAPVSWRNVRAQMDGVLISRTEQLPDRSVRIRGLGIADPTLALAYNVGVFGPVGVFVDLGARIPIDDNPRSNTLPSRMPPSTGQGELFAGVGARLPGASAPDPFKPWGASLAYRLSYRPQATATYLVRLAGNQSYATGTLAARAAHTLVGRVSYRLIDALELALAPRLSISETAGVVAYDVPEAVVDEVWLLQLNLRAALRVRLSEQHALELFYRQPVFDTWHIDPLFPLAMPQQGWGLTWMVSGT